MSTSATVAKVGHHTPCPITPAQNTAMQEARVGFMAAVPFFSHYYYAEMSEVFTKGIDTLATDGRRVYINPEYLAGLKPAERVFGLAHEVVHAVCRDPQRALSYRRENNIEGKPYDHRQVNISMDKVRNALLAEMGVGMFNPSWIYDATVAGEDLWEAVYVRDYKKPEDQPPGKGPGGSGGNPTWGKAGKAPKGAQGDKVADAHDGAIDEVLEPMVDPVTGREDSPSPMEFKEAIARAAAAAKAMGNLPASLQRMVDAILEPEVDWRDHVRMVLTGRMGSRSETWSKPNRRRLALNPIIMMPGRTGYGADTVVVACDTSGSVSAGELARYLAEIGGIIADIRPRRIIVIGCDTQITQVEDVRTLDEVEELRVKGIKGGGGTSFVPVFEYVEKEGIVPDTLIYATDMMGRFPAEAPAYPVVWAATTDIQAPFGEVVRIHP